MKRSFSTVIARSWHRLIFRWRRERLYHELAEELEFHRQLRESEYRNSGLAPEAAIELTRKQMGNTTLAKEDCRNMWSFMNWERLAQDFRYAARMFGRTPVFTAVAVLSLALGIGGNAAMFSLVNGLLVRPLPYFEPERLVRLTGIYPRAAISFFQQHSRAMDIAAVSVGSELNLTGEGKASRVVASGTSTNFLTVLGTAVAKGRGFLPGEELRGRDGVAIISNSLWKERFGADPAIIGRMITLDGMHREIIGVMPNGFSYPSANVHLWIPMRLDSSNFLEYWAGEFVPLLGRLHHEASIEQGRSELTNLITQFRKTFPYPMARDWNADSTVISLQQDITGNVRGRLIILLSSVGVVLLIACANIAGLLLSRATTRRKEIAVRAALGARRMRIVRQLLTESVGLALVGAGLGIVLGISALSIFKAVLPPSMPGLAQASIDWRVVAVVAALALLTGLTFGLAPALNALHVDLTEAIRTGSQRSSAAGWARLRSWLVALEIALTLVLVISAGLLLRSLHSLSEADLGFDPAHILSVRISPNQFSCAERAACVALYDRLLEQVRTIPGVTAAAIANSVPLDGQVPALAVDIEDHPKSIDHPAPMLWSGAVSVEYLQMMHIPLLAGREFTRADAENSAPVILITASTARRYWPRENAIGKHIKPAGSQQWRTVVGIVGDVQQFRLSKALPDGFQGAIYMPYSQAVRENGQIPAAMTLLVSSNSVSARIESKIHALAEGQNPDVPVSHVQRLGDLVLASISDFRSTLRVLITFAGAALLLAGIGIYGLMSYSVNQRTYEIGLRIAIGATRRRVLSGILTQGLRISLYGILGGIAVAFLLTRFLRSQLYGVPPTDIPTFVAVTALIIGVAVLATALPAWKASRIDPARSLRAD